MNRKLRATDENENFYNVDNYQNNTPSDMVRTFIKMKKHLEYKKICLLEYKI